MQIERGSGHTVKLHETPLRIRPKGFDPVDVSSAVGELILSVANTIMLFVAKIKQAAVAAPRIGMNHAARIDSAPNNGQQRLSDTVVIDLETFHQIFGGETVTAEPRS